MAVNLPNMGTRNAIKFWCISAQMGKMSEIDQITENLTNFKKCQRIF